MTVESKKISFNNDEGRDFITVLRKRVNLYFAEKKRSPKANIFTYLKTFFMMGTVFLTYGVLVANVTGGWGIFGLYTLLAFFVAFGTMNVSHDALHGAYMTHPLGNRILGFLMDLFGASSFYWKKEHTIDHHTYTNIDEHDADLDVPILLRLCPNAPYRSFHRFQNWYAPILYSLNLLRWVYFSDYRRLYHVFKGTASEAATPSKWEIFWLLFFKCVHVFLFLVVPILTLSISPWLVVLSYLCFLGVIGVTLTVIFQLAHIVENVSFPLPNAEGKMENSFATHQLTTTSNFATKSKMVSFLFGGLNFQVEHHLLPHICHTHLPAVASIVKETTKEFGLPYYENPSFFKAVRSHFRTLKKLGELPQECKAPARPKMI